MRVEYPKRRAIALRLNHLKIKVMNHTHYLISNEDGNTFAVTPRTLVSNDSQLNFDIDALKSAIEDEYDDDISLIEYIVDKEMEEFTIHAKLSNDGLKLKIKLSPTWMY